MALRTTATGTSNIPRNMNWTRNQKEKQKLLQNKPSQSKQILKHDQCAEKFNFHYNFAAEVRDSAFINCIWL